MGLPTGGGDLNSIWLIAGHLIPVLAGIRVAYLLGLPRFSLALCVGMGVFLALIFEAAFIVVWDWFGLGFERPGMTAAWLVIAVGVYWIKPLESDPVYPARSSLSKSMRELGFWPLFSLFFVAAMFVIHVLPLATEVFYRPLYPFDATTAWATKAKVWFFAGELTPIVSKAEWLALGTSTSTPVYTDHMPDYPVAVPLLQL